MAIAENLKVTHNIEDKVTDGAQIMYIDRGRCPKYQYGYARGWMKRCRRSITARRYRPSCTRSMRLWHLGERNRSSGHMKMMRGRTGLEPSLPSKSDKVLLTYAIILVHVVRFLAPAFKGTAQKYRGMVVATPVHRAEALETQILSVASSIVKMMLGSKVPVAVICVLATDESTGRVRKGWLGARLSRRFIVKSKYTKSMSNRLRGQTMWHVLASQIFAGGRGIRVLCLLSKVE
jgi:hypothetical protein